MNNKVRKLIGPKLSNLGLARGSPLSPILFNVYTASLHSLLLENVKMVQYANYLVIYTHGRDIKMLVSRLNEQMTIFAEWFSEKSLDLLINKSRAILFRGARQKFPTGHLALKFNENNISAGNC